MRRKGIPKAALREPPRPASDLGGRNELALAMMLCNRLLVPSGPTSRRTGGDMAEDFASVRPRLLVALAHASVALAKSFQGDPKGRDSLLDVTRRWLAAAAQAESADAGVLRAVGVVLDDLYDLEGLEEVAREEFIEHACEFLRGADTLSPGDAETLCRLGTALCTRAQGVARDERVALYREAAGCFDRACRSFGRASRRSGEPEALHSGYVEAASGAAAARYWMANVVTGPKRQRNLLLWSVRNLRELLATPVPAARVRLLLGQSLLDLAWLPGDRESRRADFQEAAEQLTHAIGSCGRIPWEAWAGCAEATLAYAARRANEAEPGAGDFYLACAFHRMGRVVEAAEALVAATEGGIEEALEALADPSLARLWIARPV